MPPQSGQPTRSGKERFFVQAPIPPLHEDGVRVFLAGTVPAVLFTAVTATRYGDLADAGHGWLFWVGLCCIVIGLGGAGYCWLRRRRRSRA
ncbi:DUF2530 domain-containing protein [Propionibacterium cyclohexanicum]|nr:DUF2530 domain-containing protein [Propionibacterium cyclohexanicum]